MSTEFGIAIAVVLALFIAALVRMYQGSGEPEKVQNSEGQEFDSPEEAREFAERSDEYNDQFAGLREEDKERAKEQQQNSGRTVNPSEARENEKELGKELVEDAETHKKEKSLESVVADSPNYFRANDTYTFDQLYSVAQEADLSGRSKHRTKDDLIAFLQGHNIEQSVADRAL